MALEDKTLTCRECGQEFIFTAGEQEFYLSRNLVNEPRRSYPAICAACGAETTVPFEPRDGRPVYCRECYTKMRQSGDVDQLAA